MNRAQHGRRPSPPSALVAILFALLHLAAAAPLFATSSQWANPAGGAWSVATNWNPASVPLTPGDSATLGDLVGMYTISLDALPVIDAFTMAAGSSDQLNLNNSTLAVPGGDIVIASGRVVANAVGSALTGNLVIGAGAIVEVLNSGRLTLNGDLLTNDGVVDVGSSSVGTARLRIASDMSFTGAGVVSLLSNWTNTMGIEINPGVTLTNEGGHTISGTGRIEGGTLVNAGLISADGVLDIRTADMTNTGMLTSTNGSLLIRNATIENAGGEIAHGGGLWVVLREGARVHGGEFTRNGAGTIGVDGPVTIRDVVINPTVQFEVLSGRLIVEGPVLTNNGNITCEGSSAQTDSLVFADSTTLAGDGSVSLRGTASRRRGIVVEPGAVLTVAAEHQIEGAGFILGEMVNLGELRAQFFPLGDLRRIVYESSGFTNTGVVVAAKGDSMIFEQPPTNYVAGTLDGGSWQAVSNGVLRMKNASIQVNNAEIILSGPNARFLGTTGGALSALALNESDGRIIVDSSAINISADFTNEGVLRIERLASLTQPAGGQFTQNAGSSEINGALNGTGTIDILGGILSADAVLNADVTNEGELQGGALVNELLVTGDYSQGASGALRLRLGRRSTGTWDVLRTPTGATLLDGDLAIDLILGFSQVLGDQYAIVRASALQGTFARVLVDGVEDNGTLFQVTYTDTSVVLTVNSVLFTAVGEPLGDDARGAGVWSGAALSTTVPSLAGRLVWPGEATFELSLPAAAEVRLDVFDATGRRIGTLADSPLASGRHTFALDSSRLGAAHLPSGVYFAIAEIAGGGQGARRATARVLLVR
jgi:hypothetical protein